jgi:predicted phosphodiesterase
MSIIVGDIHGDLEKAQAFLAYKPGHEHIALGDYLDSFYEPIERQIECIKLLMD